MFLSLFSLLLILAITFYQGLQGLFSAVITCVVTVLAAALAFGLYEDVYYQFLLQPLPDQGRAIALVGIFVIAALVLRFLYDGLFKGNMQFPVYVERAGGGLFGFITAMTTVGVLTVGLQLLPFGESFLGFQRFVMMDKDGGGAVTPEESPELDYWSKLKPVRKQTWLNADGFAVATASLLADNGLRGRQDISFVEVYPDLLGAAYRANQRLTKDWQTSIGNPDSLRVLGYWDAKPNEFWRREPKKGGKDGNEKVIAIKPAGPEEGGLKRLVVRVTLDGKARDKNGFCFRSDQIRLVGREGKSPATKEYLLAGVNLLLKEKHPEATGKLIEVYPGEPFDYQPEEPKFDFVFRVPDRPDFQPLFVEYKMNARGDFEAAEDLNTKPHPPLGPKPKVAPKPTPRPQNAPPIPKPLENPEPAPAPEPQANTSDSGSQSSSNDGRMRQGERHGRVHGIGPAKANESGYTDQLPFELTSYDGAEASGGVLRGGHVFLRLADDWSPPAGQNAPITKFEVPPGRKLLQLSVEKLQPGSWLGSVLGNARDTMQDIYLVDAGGTKWMPVGSYAMAKVGGGTQKVFELRYLNEIERGDDPSGLTMTKLPKFEHIKGVDLKGEGDYVYYFLFHVTPGTRPDYLNTGGRNIDLKGVVPDAPK